MTKAQIKITMIEVEGAQKNEMQERLDRAFDILFRAVIERRKSKKSDILSG